MMENSERLYVSEPGEAQLSFRAVAAGCGIGAIVSCTNIYIGLKIGWTFGASIIAAVLSFSLFAAMGRRLSVLETNIAQTAGSAAGQMASAAGFVAAIPALQLMGYEIAWPSLVIWSTSIAFLGVFFAVPLRRQMVVAERLRFPTGTATAETILAMYSEARDAAVKARALLVAAAAAGAYTLAYHFVPQLESPPLHEWLPSWAALGVAAAWGFKIYLGPSLFGAGLLIGPRVVLSLLIGAVLAWALLGPWAQSQGWAAGEVMSYSDGPRGWLLWPGVALMVCEALMALALSWRTFYRALTAGWRAADEASQVAQAGGEDLREAIPPHWWMGGLAAGSLVTLALAQWAFDIPWYLSLVAIALSAVLAVVATRSVGETDINPVGGMGKVTQLVFGGLAPGQTTTNLLTAAITGAGASQAADMMQDLKTGYMLGASPRKQFIAQLWGIVAGVIVVVPVYYGFSRAYEIGGEKLPAPAAFAWKAMAELLAKGWDSLPPHAELAVGVAGAAGALLPLIRRIPALRAVTPSGMAIGIAFIIPAYYSLVMVYGLLAYFLWRRASPQAADQLNFAVASGLIAGEGLAGMVNALLTIAGVGPLT